MVDPGSTLRTVTTVLGGSGGIAIAGTEVFGRVPPLGIGESAIALTALAVPLTYACYKASMSIITPTPARTTDAETMDAEELKQKTERWSEESAIHPAFPPGQGPNRQSASPTKPPSPEVTSGSNEPPQPARDTHHRPSKIDMAELEFNWQTQNNVSFTDIGGMDDIKDELRAEVITPVQNPKKAEKLGVAAPNILFHGPPGTGKTFMSQALATELGFPFVKLSGADIQSKWINESSTMVNTLFSEARKMAAHEGGAVVFIDELDSVLKTRTGSGSSHEEDNKVVNEFLQNLENTKDHNIVFIGATNRLDAVDQAGIRSGRVDLQIRIGEPDAKAREAILDAQLDDREHEISEPGIKQIAAVTEGFVAADLEALIDRAAKQVLARGGLVIQPRDVSDVIRS